MEKSIKCIICDINFKNLSLLQKHISTKHKEVNLNDYYDNNINEFEKPKCVFCDNYASFHNFTIGYKKICNSKECLSKSRATFSIEYGIKMLGLSEDDAKARLNELNNKKAITFKNTISEIMEKNPNFNKEKSHQCEEYWIKRGYSKEEAAEKIKAVFDNIHTETWKKRRENPENYKDVNTTQIGYWMKKGYSEKESKQKIKERQKTFTLEKCIEKYGEEDGTNRYKERNKKWSELMEEKYINGDYVRYGTERYSKIEIEFFNELVEKYNIDINKIIQQKTIKINKVYNLDFVYDESKVIEFFGDYWHCNPNIYKKDYYHKHFEKFADEIWNYDEQKITNLKTHYKDVLVIWESDFRLNPNEVFNKCKEFLFEK